MTEWELYAARGILNNGKFDPTQIEEGLKSGLQPQVVLVPGAQNGDVITELCNYLKHKDLEDIPLKLAAHGKGEFQDSKDIKHVYESIDIIVDLNKKMGQQIIGEVVFHAGAVHNYEEEYELRKSESLDLVDASFCATEYMAAHVLVKTQIEIVSKFAALNDVQVVIENVGQVNYGVISTMNVDDKTQIDKKDPRWGKTLYIPEPLQLGDIGCVHDLNELVGNDGFVCIDIEHLHQSREYSKLYNLQLAGEQDLDPLGQRVLEQFGICVQKGKPVLFKEDLGINDVIESYKDKVSICHLSGQVSMFYSDNGTRKIGSHMPVTFGHQDNEYYDDKNLMVRHNCARESNMKNYLSALHKAGCRKGVFEIHLGSEYTGKRWQRYHKLACDNVREIVDKF